MNTQRTLAPTYLNAAGKTYVAERLAELAIAWDVEATINEICDRPGFMELQPGDSYDYEITNTKAKIAGVSGVGGYGVFAYIHIDADEHVTFEPIED